MPANQLIECDDMAAIYSQITNGKRERIKCRANTPGLSDAHARKLGIQLTPTSLHNKLSTRPNNRILSATSNRSYDTSYSLELGDRLPHLDHRNYIRQMTAGTGLARLHKYTVETRNGALSVPPNYDTQTSSILSPRQRAKTAPPQRLSSLALFSPQTQRFTTEQLALEQTRLLKRLTTKQSHRVEHKYYVSGRPFPLKPKYQVNEQQHKFLLEITNEKAQIRSQKAKKEEMDKWQVEQSPAENTHVLPSPRLSEHDGNTRQPETQPHQEPSVPKSGADGRDDEESDGRDDAEPGGRDNAERRDDIIETEAELELGKS